MSERCVLAACIASRGAYEQVSRAVEKGDFTDQAGMIYSGVVDYYNTDASAENIDAELLSRQVARGISNPKHKETFTDLITTIAGTSVSPTNVVQDFIAVKREACGHRLASALASAQDLDNINALIDEYSDWSTTETLGDDTEEESLTQGVDLVELTENHFNEGDLIRLFPKSLNERLDGGCLKGHHVVLFATPETGKTMFLMNLMYGFVRQGKRVLYCGNEDPIADVKVRFATRLLGKTKFDVLSDGPGNTALLLEAGGNLVHWAYPVSTPREVERLTVTVEPDIILIDQLRNLQMKEDNFTQQLEKAARAVRSIGQRHKALVVSVTQAGDSARNKAVLDMGDVDSSKTGVAAQADVMVGMGMNAEDEASGRRVLSLCKNKRSGRHDFFPVGVDPHLSKITSIT